ncbi:HAD-IC family P-type ATPase [Dactylosporangium vinaceum]|uniref:Cation-translocating P-type ATPase n=1 Tax=Dactylosporangium vinaceum TaxID=53362 RepID=A0ABV5MN19_9ACTN|nr:cation-translocating P-type ATPase [Dactylosporangium vinaceum]UAB92342.1 HAD-IC family P-type ATPase [Dactylosporangium vinaceum]
MTAHTYFDEPADAVLHALGGTATGLPAAERAARRARYGPNRPGPVRRPKRWLPELAEAFTEPLQLLLIAVAVLSAVFGELSDAVAIAAVIAVVAVLETSTEMRAARSIEALRAMTAPTARLVTPGGVREVPAADLVPGDVVAVEAGDVVPADARVIAARGLRVDESTLTGEAAAVGKSAVAVPAGTPLAARSSMLHAGTAVVAGDGRAVLTATGTHSELGRLGRLVAETREPPTPLQRTLTQLAKAVLVIAIAASVAVPLVGVLAGQPVRDMLLSGLTIAFATVPEELPILVVVLLAVGGRRLARRGALLRRLRAGETIGAVDVIVTDKTGTLTENRLELTELVGDRRAILTTAVAAYPPGGREPMEQQLLAAAAAEGIAEPGPALTGHPFDPQRKLLSRVHRTAGDGLRLAVAGAPEAVLERCVLAPAARARIEAEVADRARRGLRVIAFAERSLTGTPTAPAEDGDPADHEPTGGPVDLDLAGGSADGASTGGRGLTGGSADRDLAGDTGEREVVGGSADRDATGGVGDLDLAGGVGERDEVEAGLRFTGLACFTDPLRPDVAAAVATLQGAGVATIVVTGDHPETAAAVAAAAGLPTAAGAAPVATLHGPGTTTIARPGDTRETAAGRPDADRPAAADRLANAGLSAAAGRLATAGPSAGRLVARGDLLTDASDEELAPLLVHGTVVARATPAAKHRLVQALQARGHTVAVTGDGANDAPALAAADVGIAMGRRGADLARAAADIVLTDDAYPTVVAAVATGRNIGAQLRRAVAFYLGAKVALVIVLLTALAAGLPVPFAPVHIVLLEIFMDLGASVAFVAEPTAPHAMHRPPRPSGPRFLDRAAVTAIATVAVTLTLAVLPGYLLLAHDNPPTARAAAVLGWLAGHALIAWTLRTRPGLAWRTNAAFPAWAAAATAVALLATLTPAGRLLHLDPLTARDTAIVTLTVAAAVILSLATARATHLRDRL